MQVASARARIHYAVSKDLDHLPHSLFSPPFSPRIGDLYAIRRLLPVVKWLGLGIYTMLVITRHRGSLLPVFFGDIANFN
jgi:hypothetical protein